MPALTPDVKCGDPVLRREPAELLKAWSQVSIGIEENMKQVPAAPATPEWRKSTFSGNSGCVEVRMSKGKVLVRDSKSKRSPVLVFTAHEWACFTQGVLAGEFLMERLAND